MNDTVNDITDTTTGEDDKKFFIENVARYCDKCGRAYEPDDVEILQQTEYSVIIHFACANCKARHLATFIKPLGITSRIPVNTDLSVNELAKFAGKRSVSTNDVLDVHEILKEEPVTMNTIVRRSTR